MTRRYSLISGCLHPIRLNSRMVRAVVPPCTVGAYALIELANGDSIVRYVGRSCSLRQRLLSHARRALARYFVIEPCESIWVARNAEYRAYRRLRPVLNMICPSELPRGHPSWGSLIWPVSRYALVQPVVAVNPGVANHNGT